MNDNRRILNLAFPAILSNITVPLLGLSDTAIAGHLGAPVYLASMSVGAAMINLSFWLFGFLRMGTTGLTARAYGRDDSRALSDLFCRSLFWGAAIGVLLMLFSGFLGDILLRMLSPGAQVGEGASLYYRYCIMAAPAQLGIMAMSGWMVGMQSTFWPMVVAISTNIVNIPLSLFLVFVCGHGFAGLAAGTCVAQWVGALLAFIFCLRLWKVRMTRRVNGPKVKSEELIPLLSGFRNLWRSAGEGNFFGVNIYLFFRSAALIAILMGMTAFAGRNGEMALAVNAVILQFFYFFSYFMDGFAYAAEALTGKLAGSGQREGLRKMVGHLLGWCGVMVLIFTLLYITAGKEIVSLLTDSDAVAAGVKEMGWVLYLLPAVSVGAFIYDGIFIGLSRTGWMLVSTLTAAVLFYIVNLTGLRSIMENYPSLQTLNGNEVVWIGFLGALLLRGLILALAYPRVVAGSVTQILQENKNSEK